MKVLIVEDGHEYIETLGRFLPEVDWDRAGSGPAALVCLAGGGPEALLLDMRFDRVPPEELLGDLDEAADRFNGDPVRARRFLEDHQGNYVLAAVRDAGHRLPVLMSYDFSGEPRRWARLAERYAPVDYLPDNAGPGEVLRRLEDLVGGSV